MSTEPVVSIVIFTRNRRAEVLTALESCYAQSYRPLEVLVFDDASTDDTESMVRQSFPGVRFFREEQNRGIAALRNRGLREAKGEFVFSIDDDAFYTDPGTIGQIVEHFRRDPAAAVIAMPFIEPLREVVTSRDTPESKEGRVRLRAFVACAHAVRRETALGLGGYREFFFYRGEERDLSIRLLEHGKDIVFGASPPVVHVYSQKRAWEQMFPLGIRNNLLFDWLNIPHPYVLPRLVLDAGQLMLYKIRLPRVLPRFYQILCGFLACARYTGLRKPVSRATYRLYRTLPNHGPVPTPKQVPGPLRRTGRG